jgi:DNA-binding SARP family transcriptional activator
MSRQLQDSDRQLRIHLLGRFEVQAGDHVLIDRTWSRRKAGALLKLLALQRDRSLHREQVFDALWPELDLTAAANNLHKNLYHLRAALAGEGGAGVARLSADTLTLSPDIWIDVDQFRRLAQQTRTQHGNTVLYEEALSLYAGDLLPEDLYDDWTEPQREELRAECVRLLLEVSHLYDEQGRPELAVERLERLLQVDGLNEDAHRRLMLLYARAGSRHRALRQYQTCRDRLQRELGVEPSEETQELHRQIVDGKIDAGAQRPTSPSVSTNAVAAQPQALPPMFGRERELEQAEDILEQVIGGRGQTLLVSGVAGIGKSRYVQQVLAAAAEHGAVALTGRSFELEATAAYQPVRDMLRQVLSQVRDARVLQTLHGSLYLKRLLPDVATEALPTADTSLLQMELFNEALHLFRTLAAQHPVVLFFDDLHAADDATLRLLHVLCRELPHHRILLIATYRTEDADSEPLRPFLSSLRREGLLQELRLSPLPQRALGLAIEQLFDGQPVEHDLVAEIGRHAEGNPFYAAELVRTLQDDGAVRFTEGRWQRRSGAALPVPGSVRDLVDRRLGRLGDAAHDTLRLAAVLGRTFDYTVLRRVLPIPEHVLLDALDDTISSFILEEAPEGYRFRHQLLQEAIYRSMTRVRRQQLHRTVAALLESDAAGHVSPDVETIGYHFSMSDEAWRAVPYLQAAAKRAAVVFANDQAVSFYDTAIGLAESHPNQTEPGQLAALLEERSDVVRRMGDIKDAIPGYQRALQLLDQSGDGPGVIRVRGKAALCHIIEGNVGTASDLLATTVQAMDDEWPHYVVTRTYYLLAQFHWHSGRYREALEAAEKALQAAEAGEDIAERARAYEAMALACHALGDWQRGVDYELNRQALGVPGFSTDEAFDAHL